MKEEKKDEGEAEIRGQRLIPSPQKAHISQQEYRFTCIRLGMGRSKTVRLSSTLLGTFQSAISKLEQKQWGQGQADGELEAVACVSTPSVVHVGDPEVTCTSKNKAEMVRCSWVGTDFEWE